MVGGTLWDAGAAQRWNRDSVLWGLVKDLMSQGGTCLKGVVRTHKGVVCGLTAADEWPAALVDNQSLGKRVVIGGTKDEYEELLRLMVVAGSVCVKVGKGDWVEEGDTFLAGGLNVPVKLRFEMDDCEMSHVEEAPAVAAGMEPVYVSVGDSLSNPHGKRVGRVTNVGAGDVYLPARKPFMRGRTNKTDDLDPILGADKGKVPSKWANDLSEMSLYWRAGVPLRAGIRMLLGRRRSVVIRVVPTMCATRKSQRCAPISLVNSDLRWLAGVATAVFLRFPVEVTNSGTSGSARSIPGSPRFAGWVRQRRSG